MTLWHKEALTWTPSLSGPRGYIGWEEEMRMKKRYKKNNGEHLSKIWLGTSHSPVTINGSTFQRNQPNAEHLWEIHPLAQWPIQYHKGATETEICLGDLSAYLTQTWLPKLI